MYSFFFLFVSSIKIYTHACVCVRANTEYIYQHKSIDASSCKIVYKKMTNHLMLNIMIIILIEIRNEKIICQILEYFTPYNLATK